MNIRYPAVAGQFYDDNPESLQAQIEHWLVTAQHSDAVPNIRAIIVPHAGYRYSGENAAQAYHLVKSQKDNIHKVLLVGPSHRIYFEGCAIPQCDQFHSPLGNVSLCRDEIEKLRHHSSVTISDDLHRLEHSLEVQLPFLQACLGNDFELIPVMTCDIRAETVAEIIEPLWRQDTLLVVSSDLSHFHTYADANAMDLKTCDKIEHFNATLTPQEACGCTGINALSILAKKHSFHIQRLQRNNSGDTSGDKSRVVGYVSYVITEI